MSALDTLCKYTHTIPKNHADSDFCRDMLGQDVGQFFIVWFKFLSRGNHTKNCIIWIVRFNIICRNKWGNFTTQKNRIVWIGTNRSHRDLNPRLTQLVGQPFNTGRQMYNFQQTNSKHVYKLFTVRIPITFHQDKKQTRMDDAVSNQNILVSKFCVLFRGMWWKINCLTSRSMEKSPGFCTSGLGVMLRVSNMNDGLKECAFQHIILKIISYLINSQLKQVCDKNWYFLENHA